MKTLTVDNIFKVSGFDLTFLTESLPLGDNEFSYIKAPLSPKGKLLVKFKHRSLRAPKTKRNLSYRARLKNVTKAQINRFGPS